MKFKDKLYKNIEASKIDIDHSNIENTYQNIVSILINNKVDNIINKETIYFIESHYRDNLKEKLIFINK